MRGRAIAAVTLIFGAGVLVGRGLGPAAAPTARAQAGRPAPANPYAQMLHVGILVPDLEEAVAKWKAMGFDDIRVLEPSRGVDRRYHGKPIDVALKQAFIHGTSPQIELMEPVGDGPSPWGDYLRKHGEAIHHLAYRIPETAPEIAKYRALGMPPIAEGKWPEGDTHWGTFHYLQDPEGGVIIEFISRVPRAEGP